MADLDLMTLQSALAQQQFAPVARAGGAQLGPFGLPLPSGGGQPPAPVPSPGGEDGGNQKKIKFKKKPAEVNVYGKQFKLRDVKSMMDKIAHGPRGVPLNAGDDPSFVQLADMPKEHPFRAQMEALMEERKLAIHGISLDALSKGERAVAEHLFGPALQAMMLRQQQAEERARMEAANAQAR